MGNTAAELRPTETHGEVGTAQLAEHAHFWLLLTACRDLNTSVSVPWPQTGAIGMEETAFSRC